MAGANANYFDKYDQPVVAQKPVAPTNYFDKYDQPVASPVAPQVVAGQSTPPLAVVRPAPKPNIDTMLPLPKAGPTQKQEPEGGLLQDAVAGYKSSPRQQFDEQDLNPLRPLAQGVDEFLKDSQAGVDMMKSGANRFATSEPGSLERLASAPEMVMGALGYAASPFTGAVRGLVTNPVAKATGLPTSYVDIAAQGVVGAEIPGMRKVPTTGEALAAKPQVRQQMKTALENPELPKAEIPQAAPIPPGAGEVPLSGTPLGQAPANRTPVSTAPLNPIQAVAKKVEQIFSPSSVDQYSRRAEAQIREETGIAARDTEAFKASMDEFHTQLGAATPGQKREFMAYMQGRTTGAALPDPRMQPVADALKTSFQKIEDSLKQFDRIDDMNFKENYFPQMWKDPVAARQFFGTAARQGRTGFTKKRIFETIEDGLAAGLELKHDNPIDTAIEYMTNAHNFIGTERIFQDARDARTVRYVAPNKIPAGWLPVNGRLGEKTIPGTGLRRIAVAPEGWARRYNNHISKSLDGPGGEALEAFRKTANGVTAFELGLSGFHAFTSAGESMNNTLARVVDQLSYGKPVSALGTLAKYPISPVLDYMKGAKGKKEYLRPGSTDPRTAYLVDVISRAGGRMAQVEDYYATSGRRGYLKGSGAVVNNLKMGNISEALRDAANVAGRSAREFGEDLTKDMGTRPISGLMQGVFRTTANVLDTTMAPLFKDIIPKLKNGAAMNDLSAWLDAHPGASDMEVLKAGREIWDTIDNRFGEMVQDNVGYTRFSKDVLQAGFRSWSYFYGQVAREYGGALADTATMPLRIGERVKQSLEARPTNVNGQRVWTTAEKNIWTRKQSYMLTAFIHMAAVSTLAGYLMTGKLPSDMMDLRAPKTGGKTTSGKPERVNIPGSVKEIFNTAEEGPLTVASRKVGTLPTMFYEYLTNKDWKQNPITPGAGAEKLQGVPGVIEAFGDYMYSKLGPIAVKNLMAGQKKGSAITPLMTIMGFQPSGARLTDPEGQKHWQDKRERDAWMKKQKQDRKDRELRK